MDTEQLVNDPWSMTLLDFLRLMKEYNVRLVQMRATANDEPTVCVIGVRGKEECAEILEAIRSVEHRWELQRAVEEKTEIWEEGNG